MFLLFWVGFWALGPPEAHPKDDLVVMFLVLFVVLGRLLGPRTPFTGSSSKKDPFHRVELEE